MGMDYSACYVDVVGDDFVKEMCPSEHTAFFAAIDEGDLRIERVADGWNECDFGLHEADEATIARLWVTARVLEAKFKEVTGLELELCYHDEDDACRGDEIVGWFWCVEGVYTYTKSGAKYRDRIFRKSFVSFG